MNRCPACGHFHVHAYDGYVEPCMAVVYGDLPDDGIHRCYCGKLATAPLPQAA